MHMPLPKLFRAAATGVAVGLTLMIAGCGKSGGDKVTADDMSMGSPTAKVTVIEYASVACPLCAHFNKDVMPQFKAKYIDTGKVHYIYRPMLTGVPTIASAGELLARCAGKDKYFQVVDAIMRGQDEMYKTGETDQYARPVLLRVAASVGMSEAEFTKCVSDPKALDHLNELNTQYAKGDASQGTPTFVINGKKLTRTKGDITDFDAVIEPLLAAK